MINPSFSIDKIHLFYINYSYYLVRCGSGTRLRAARNTEYS